MENAISIKNLSVSYGDIGAISNINLEIKTGEFLGITGPNGGGKTTLLNAVLGLINKENGNISILGSDIKKGRNFIGYVPQTASIDKDFPISVIETVLTAFLNTGLHPFKKYSKTEKEIAIKVLNTVGLSRKNENQISELSGGEFQRLLIARAIARNPKILLLDEPTSNIDKNSRKEIYSLLKRLNEDGTTIVMVTHDFQNIGNIFSRLLCINQTIVYDGDSALFFKEDTK